MNTLFMLTCMILIFIFTYFVPDRIFVNPIVLFCLPMIVSVMYGLQYYSGWRFNVSSKTMFLVISSFLVFCFAFFLVSIFIRDRGFRRKSDEYNEINTVFLLRDNVYLLS